MNIGQPFAVKMNVVAVEIGSFKYWRMLAIRAKFNPFAIYRKHKQCMAIPTGVTIRFQHLSSNQTNPL